MTLTQMIIGIAVVLVIILLVLFPEFRALFKGFVRVFIKDMATTPEGAEAIYAEKIDQAQESYNRADNALTIASGKLNEENKKLAMLKEKLANVESKCEALVKAGKMNEAQIKVEEREELLSDIARSGELIKTYKLANDEALLVHQHCEKNLRLLKRESKDVVENMKIKKQMAEVYDNMNELKAQTSTDKLLESVKEKNSDLNVIAEGARVVHESKLSTRIQKADAEANKLVSNSYLDDLKKKYS